MGLNKAETKNNISSKENFKQWLKDHAGEYLMKRVEVREKMNDPKQREHITMALKQAEENLRKAGRDESGEWLLERQAAAGALLVDSVKNMTISDSDAIYAFIETEEEMDNLIRRIQELKPAE